MLQKSATKIKQINELPNRPVKMLSSGISSTKSSNSDGYIY